MGAMLTEQERRRIAEAVRQACLAQLCEAYETAGYSGLCAEGRWDFALDHLRNLELDPVILRALNEANQAT